MSYRYGIQVHLGPDILHLFTQFIHTLPSALQFLEIGLTELYLTILLGVDLEESEHEVETLLVQVHVQPVLAQHVHHGGSAQCQTLQGTNKNMVNVRFVKETVQGTTNSYLFFILDRL